MRDGQTNEQLKIELLSQWKLEAEFRKNVNFFGDNMLHYNIAENV